MGEAAKKHSWGEKNLWPPKKKDIGNTGGGGFGKKRSRRGVKKN